MIASCSTVLPRVGRGNEFSAIGGSNKRWQRRRPDSSRYRRREARLVLASIPGAHGMFATSESVMQPLILLSDTVRRHTLHRHRPSFYAIHGQLVFWPHERSFAAFPVPKPKCKSLFPLFRNTNTL